MTPSNPGAIEAPAIEALATTRLVPRRCELADYAVVTVPSFAFAGQCIAYASPEATYAVTRRLLARARHTILIGIYDFTAGYLADRLIEAVRRKVRVRVMVDLDNREGENELWANLLAQGCIGVPAPSCASKHIPYFPSCHEKVIVIDDTWTLVQSGNYSDASIPRNERDGGDPAAFAPGNRDMGLAVKSPALAAFFSQILAGDMQLELDAARRGMRGFAPIGPAAALAAVRPPQMPPQRFPSQRFQPRKPITIQPVLSPDNYMAVVPELLASATRSIEIEEQYIRGQQPQVRRLLEAIRAAMDRHPDLTVRIVLARPIGDADVEAASRRALAEFGLLPGTHVRYLNPKYFLHCHNKLVIIDRQTVLVGSQNWSDTAVSQNREASLLVRYAPLARYYGGIFEQDWQAGIAPTRAGASVPTRATTAAAEGAVIQLSSGDYAEV